MKFHPNFVLKLLPVLAILSATPGLAASSYEMPGPMKTAKMLPPALLQGKYYRLDPQVKNDGLFNRYTIRSDFGNFSVVSNTLLKIRLYELDAIAAMREVETSNTALQALGQSGKSTLIGIKNLLISPVDTINGAADGVGDMVTRSTGTIRRKAGETEDSRFEQIIGLSKAKGKIASRFGVNMYSRNLVLQKELDRLAHAAYAGGLGVSLATSFVPGVGGLMLSTSGAARMLNESINDTPAAEIWLNNKTKLEAMKLGFPADKVEIFLNNPVFSPALETVLVTALEALKGVKNRRLFLHKAYQLKDVQSALAITSIAVMAARYNRNIAPIREFRPMARLISAVLGDGSALLLLPTDYLLWTEKNARVVADITARSKRRRPPQLWTLGRLSPKTRAALHARGWKVRPEAGRLLKIKKK